MGSNIFSDMLKPVSDYLESIPVLGDIISFADKVALNTDPSQLGTSLIGKMVGGKFEDRYTSEDARKGASHNIGIAALAYLLGGSGAAAGEGAGIEGGAGAEVSEEVAASNAANMALVDADLAASATPEGLAPLSSYTMGGAPLATGEVGVAATASGELAPLSSYTLGGVKEASLTDKLLTVKNANNLLRIAKILNPPKENPSIDTGTAAPGKQVDPTTTDINKLMENALGPDKSSLTFDNKGVTLKNIEQNALYKSFLSGNRSSIMSTKTKNDLAIKDRVKTKSTLSKFDNSMDNEFSHMRDTSIANPFR